MTPKLTIVCSIAALAALSSPCAAFNRPTDKAGPLTVRIEAPGTVTQADLQAAVDSFIPSAQGLEKEMQELVAVLECTDRGFLPEDWRQRIEQPEGVRRLQQRLTTLRELID